jgi:hypothetical protein
MCNAYNRNIYPGTHTASSVAVVLESNRRDKREESCDAVPRFHTQRVGARRDSSPQDCIVRKYIWILLLLGHGTKMSAWQPTKETPPYKTFRFCSTHLGDTSFVLHDGLLACFATFKVPVRPTVRTLRCVPSSLRAEQIRFYSMDLY